MNRANATTALQRQALLDLIQRARGGVAVHLVLWLLITGLSGLWMQVPWFFAVVGAAFGASLAGRLWTEPRLASLSLEQPGMARTIYLVLLLANPALWGIATALAMHWQPIAHAAPPIMFVSIGVAASGGMALAIDPFVRNTYAPLTVLPMVAALLASGPGQEPFLAVAAIIFLFYIHRASAVVQRDYWQAVQAHAILARHARQLEQLSITDALTQVSNRLHFDRRMTGEWARAERETEALSVVMVDVDNFKKVNDTYGHPFGDKCLTAVAAALQCALVRPCDLVARYGGEEFVVMLPATDAQGAAAVSMRMQASISELNLCHDGQRVKLTCSIGVFTAQHPTQCTPEVALSNADQALYEAKRSGRNRVVVFSPSLAPSTTDPARQTVVPELHL